MAELFDRFWNALIQVLPLSPFSAYFDTISGIDSQWLGWLNWFFPVTECLAVMAAWLVCIGLYYAYQLVMRWIGVIA